MEGVFAIMNRSLWHSRTVLAALLALSIVAGAGAASAVAHEGGSHCTANLEKYGQGGTFTASCVSPFQGFPVGVAGVYHADDPLKGPSTLDADIHVEITALLADGTSRAIGVECVDYLKTDVARCFNEFNPITTPVTGAMSLTAPEPMPAEIVALKCNAHTHSYYPSYATPSGAFACWSTDAAREDLAEDYWFRDNGFPPHGS